MSGDRISLAVINSPEIRFPGRLVGIEGKSAELAVEGPHPIGRGALVEFETKETLYLGEVESSEAGDTEQRLRVTVEHSLDLEKAAWIQKLWNAN
jgi:hypothetical protein